MSDEILNEIFAVTDGTTEDGKKDLPAFPGEKPAKSQLLDWCDLWEDSLKSNGFSAQLRGNEPFEIKKLQERPRMTVPADADAGRKAAIDSKNADIDHTNAINLEEKEARLLEIQSRLVGKLSKAMRNTAPIKLDKLLSEHKYVDTMGTPVPDAYNGVNMFLAICKEAKDGDVSSYSAKWYEDAYDKLKKMKLPDNSSPDMFSNRINKFVVKVNPFMDRPLEGNQLGRFILSQLPKALDSDARNLLRDLERRSELKSTTTVIAEALEL